ncbi:MAG: glyoxalase [Candidatus Cloacimonadota bacterium]|nr:MAG: glyoxalase [Candidatus Cloacimonadota bacterium]
MNKHGKINYLEIPVKNINQTKEFFKSVFDFNFTDYGPNYTSFINEGIDGGFYESDSKPFSSSTCALIIFYSSDLEETQVKVSNNNGTIVKKTFTFPGGRRFHFEDPNGNEYAVWSE